MTDQLPAPPSAPPPPTPPKPRRWPWVAGIVAALLIGIGIGAAATPEEEEQIPVAEAPASPSPPPLPSQSPPAETTVEETTEPPNLDGTWVVTACDLQLFTGGDTSTLVGAVEVENTGNVPALVTVSLKWDALPGPPPDGGTKDVTLNPGASRELRFTTRISGSDVDRVQSSPGYQAASDEKFCKVMASIDVAS